MKKKSIIILISILVVIVIILIVALAVSRTSSDNNEEEEISLEAEEFEPELELSVEVEDGKTYIYANASIEGENTIESVVLPNGENVEDSTFKYEVTEIGEYKFTAIASNGSSITETITVDALNEFSSNDPYVPDAFTHVNGTEVETGYVIEDEVGNQFVWVPVENGNLKRNTSSNTQYEESDSTATGFYNSVLKYCGFYIARYEACSITYDNVETIASMPGYMPLSNINYEDSYNYARRMATVYGYKGVKTALMNSYAWDTTLSWLDSFVSSYSSSFEYGNYSGTILKTGETESDMVNMICDLAGNLREWTTEIYKPTVSTTATNEVESEDQTEDEEIEKTEDTTYRVLRGGSANIKRYASSHGSNPETTTDAYWGFRVVLYKD